MKETTKKKIIAIGIVLLLLISSVAIYVALGGLEIFKPSKPSIHEEPPEEKMLDPISIKVMEMMGQVDESMISGYIEKITSFGPHPTAHRLLYKLSNRPIIGRFFDLPIEKVANYLYNEFESMGLEVRYHHWAQNPTIKNLRVPSWFFGWAVGDNVVATLPGADKSSDEIYLLVAHYDTMNRLGSNDFSNKIVGANDDTSGVALLLSTAKVMSQYSFNHTVRFLAVSGEEQWLMGSRAYAEEAAKNNDNIVAVINIDMIGNRGPGIRNTEVLVAGVNNSGWWIANYTINVNQRYPELLNFTIIQEDPFKEGSDHQSFLENGFDAIHIAEATQDYDWHRKSDTLKNMDVSYTKEVARLVLATVAQMAWDFNYS